MAALISSGVVVALGDELEVDDRDVRRRHADGDAVELAVELRQHEADGLGGARRGRDHRQRGGAGAVEVLVHRVERRLVAGVGVDRRHEALLDAERNRSAPWPPARGSWSCTTRSRRRCGPCVSLSWLTP